jgi:hypothetical protein
MTKGDFRHHGQSLSYQPFYAIFGLITAFWTNKEQQPGIFMSKRFLLDQLSKTCDKDSSSGLDQCDIAFTYWD